MKRSDLFREYARVIDMCEGTGVDPFHCVKVRGAVYMSGFGTPPTFVEDPNNYEFALAILEDKPVFKGDDVYFKDGEKLDWQNLPLSRKGLLPIEVLTWTKPRTFTLNGEVLPCPGGPLMVAPKYELRIANRSWLFETFDGRSAVEDAINKILSAAENS